MRTGTAVRRVSRNEPASPWLVELLDGPPIEAGAVVLATEAHASARLLDGVDPDLALQLRAIPYASSVIVNVAYRRDQVGAPARRLRRGRAGGREPVDPRRLVPEREVPPTGPRRGRSCCASSSAARPSPSCSTATTRRSRRSSAPSFTTCSAPAASRCLIEVGRHPRAMPQYTLGHLDRVEAIRRQAARHPRLILAGIAFDGVGIPDCVHAAELAADAALSALAEPAAPAAA